MKPSIRTFCNFRLFSNGFLNSKLNTSRNFSSLTSTVSKSSQSQTSGSFPLQTVSKSSPLTSSNTSTPSSSRFSVGSSLVFDILPHGNSLKISVTGPLGTVQFQADGVARVEGDAITTAKEMRSHVKYEKHLAVSKNPELVSKKRSEALEKERAIAGLVEKIFFARKQDAFTFVANLRNSILGVQRGFFIRLVLKGIGYVLLIDCD